jgi:Glycosyl transferase family 2
MTSKLAIIVEWDNARLSEVDRAREMLRRLSHQASEVARDWNGKVDLMLVVDPDEIPEDVPRSVLDECVDRDRWPGSVSLITAPGLSYYDQKNFGVKQTDAEFIVFIDSDVVPDDGWLKQICDAMRDPSVDAVGGETYLSTDTLYDRLCAAFWNFDVRPDGKGLYETTNFYANNICFRGDVIRNNPFPAAETFRGQCTTLAKSLRAKGIKLFRVRSATVSHPPPEGLRHFVFRAICQGHDTLLNSKNKRLATLRASPLGSIWRFTKGTLDAPRRIWERRGKAGVGMLGMIGAFALSVTYSTLMLFGEIATLISPKFVRKHFAV